MRSFFIRLWRGIQRSGREIRDWGTLALLVFTTAFTALTYSEMRDEQRPWIGISELGTMHDKNGALLPTQGRDFGVVVMFKNVGHKPAIHVIADLKMFLSTQQAFDGPLYPCSDCGSGELIMPDVPMGRTPHLDGAALTPGAMQSLRQNKMLIVLMGRVDYQEVGGAAHKTFICELFHSDGSFIGCDGAESNYAD